jgi:hypothetical protein
MKTTATAVLLVFLSIAVGSQSAIPATDLQPYRINKIIVAGLGNLQNPRISITGKTAYQGEATLFVAEDIGFAEQMECLLYIDDTIQSIRVEIASSSSNPQTFEYSTVLNPYRIKVLADFGWNQPLPAGYRNTTTIEQLRPGDILVLSASPILRISGSDVRRMLDRGIHIITTDSGLARIPLTQDQSPWYGTVMLIDSLDSTALTLLLEKRRQMFFATKKRYHDLISNLDFYGIPGGQRGALNFEKTRIQDITATLEQQFFPDRITDFHRMLILAFYLPVMIMVAVLKRTTTLVLLTAALASLFVSVSLLSPNPDKSLQLQLNLHHLSSQTVQLEQTSNTKVVSTPLLNRWLPSVVEQCFNPVDFQPAVWRLRYGMYISNTGELSLSLFTAADAIKFNQLPHIAWREGNYTLKYLNPLRYWSLHEPN